MDKPGTANILLVDDHAENLLALEAALDGLGHNLVKAQSGNEALRRLLEDEYALVLLDAHMPEMDGFETASLVRQRDRTRFTPIVFLTAVYNDEYHMRRGYSVGAVDYLVKPCCPDVLRAKVARLVELSTRTRKLPRRVLLVEDNEDAADTLYDIMTSWGYDTRVAYTGTDGLRAAQVFSPDVCVLDIGLPGLDGYQLARQLRSNPAHDGVLLVALTAYGAEADRRTAFEAGFDHHLTKPLEPAQLRRLLASFVAV